MPTISDHLIKLGFPPEQPLAERTSLSAREKGQTYRLNLTERLSSAVFAIDGHITTGDAPRCDKLVTIDIDPDRCAEIFVELKGRNVAHAIEQLEASLRNPTLSHPSVKERRARIVARRIPANSGSSPLTRAKIRFMADYRCDLRALNSGAPDTFRPQ